MFSFALKKCWGVLTHPNLLFNYSMMSFFVSNTEDELLDGICKKKSPLPRRSLRQIGLFFTTIFENLILPVKSVMTI